MILCNSVNVHLFYRTLCRFMVGKLKIVLINLFGSLM